MNKQVNRTSVIWAIIFVVIFLTSVFILSTFSISLAIGMLIISINSILFGVYAFKQIRSIKFLDEVQIKIQLEGVSIAFVLCLLLVLILGLIGLIDTLTLENLSFLYIFPLFFLFYFIGLFISNSKYR